MGDFIYVNDQIKNILITLKCEKRSGSNNAVLIGNLAVNVFFSNAGTFEQVQYITR